jgi:HlyD family secretion protein
MFTWIRNNKIITAVTVIAVAGGVTYYASLGSDALDEIETASVQRQTVRNIVSETGVVEAVDKATIGFSATGRLEELLVQEGDEVQAGDGLARLQSSSAEASLEQAQANLSREEAILSRQLSVDETSVAAAQEKVAAAEDNLSQVIQTQNELVRSARENLYTSSLEPYLAEGEDERTDEDFTPPTVTGTYQERESGEYRLDLYRSQAPSGWSFRISGLESDIGRVSTTQPQPLGTRGLFVTFPENFAAGLDIQWVLEIPNTRSSGYTSLLNTLEQAENNRESSITTAENNLDDAQAALAQVRSQAESDADKEEIFRVTSQQAAVSAARAQVRQVRSVLNDRILHAPFDGVVTDISINLGENVSAGQPIMSIMSNDRLEISVNVPEVDSSSISVGNPVEITLNAYDDKVFAGSVTAMSPAAQITEGVRTVEITISFTDDNIPIRSGLSADVDITARVAENVLAIPGRALQRDPRSRDDYVYVREDNGSYKRRLVTTGIRASDGMVAILSGLSEGDEVATFISSEARAQLENGETEE